MTRKPVHVRTAFLLVLALCCAGCASGQPKSGRGIGNVFKGLAAATMSLGRASETERRYVEAIEVLDGEPGFAEIVTVARDAEEASHHSDPRAVSLFAKVALDCWPKLADPVAAEASDEGSETDQAVWELYHHSVAEFVRTAELHGKMDAGKLVTLTTDEGESAVIPVAHQGFPWAKEDFTKLRLAKFSDRKVLDRYWSEPGLGVPLVAVRQRETSEGYINAQIPFSATCILRPKSREESSETLSSESGSEINAVLELKDPLRIETVSYRSRQWNLARDLSAPLAIATRETDRDKFSSFLNPGRTDEKSGLRMIEPYQPGKVPLVFVHGLLSDRFTWADLVNDLRTVPGLNEHYQIWSFQYPTGQAFIRSAAEMRASLHGIVQHLDPEGDDEALSQMVLVGQHGRTGIQVASVAESLDDLGQRGKPRHRRNQGHTRDTWRDRETVLL